MNYFWLRCQWFNNFKTEYLLNFSLLQIQCLNILGNLGLKNKIIHLDGQSSENILMNGQEIQFIFYRKVATVTKFKTKHLKKWAPFFIVFMNYDW